MTSRPATLTSSRLRRLAQRSPADGDLPVERCEMCSEPIPAVHRHLLDSSTRELKCACRACALLFDRRAASHGHYRLVPERRLRLADLELSDLTWEELRLPVDMAFFFRSSAEERVMAFYPSPMGPTESLLQLDAWAQLERDNPVLVSMESDVEALLVNRARGARQHWLVPIDDCYGLVGLIRTRWKGLTGGREVWEAIGRFFEELDGRSRPASRRDAGDTPNPAAAAAAERR
ncbi:MAG: DUF5947 family protein [Solirubrobacteraceae bacterium]|jgi:hypothetical protein